MEQALLCFGGTRDWPDGYGQFVLCGLRVTEGFPVVLCFTIGCTLRASLYKHCLFKSGVEKLLDGFEGRLRRDAGFRLPWTCSQ